LEAEYQFMIEVPDRLIKAVLETSPKSVRPMLVDTHLPTVLDVFQISS